MNNMSRLPTILIMDLPRVVGQVYEIPQSGCGAFRLPERAIAPTLALPYESRQYFLKFSIEPKPGVAPRVDTGGSRVPMMAAR